MVDRVGMVAVVVEAVDPVVVDVVVVVDAVELDGRGGRVNGVVVVVVVAVVVVGSVVVVVVVVVAWVVVVVTGARVQLASRGLTQRHLSPLVLLYVTVRMAGLKIQSPAISW
jgi:hypothetical protein